MADRGQGQIGFPEGTPGEQIAGGEAEGQELQMGLQGGEERREEGSSKGEGAATNTDTPPWVTSTQLCLRPLSPGWMSWPRPPSSCVCSLLGPRSGQWLISEWF